MDADGTPAPAAAQAQRQQSATALAVALAAMALLTLKTFADDHAWRHALAAPGFALVAYGTWRNGFVGRARHRLGLAASLAGGALLLGSAVLASAPAVAALVALLR